MCRLASQDLIPYSDLVKLFMRICRMIPNYSLVITILQSGSQNTIGNVRFHFISVIRITIILLACVHIFRNTFIFFLILHTLSVPYGHSYKFWLCCNYKGSTSTLIILSLIGLVLHHGNKIGRHSVTTGCYLTCNCLFFVFVTLLCVTIFSLFRVYLVNS